MYTWSKLVEVHPTGFNFVEYLQVKTPTLFLLGAKDLRVPVSNGIQVRTEIISH